MFHFAPSGQPVNRPAVLVTGGAKRLGRAIAQGFAADGWHVVVHYRSSEQEALDLAASLPSAEVVQFDLADHHAVQDAAEELANSLPDWSALVCSASLFEPDRAIKADWDNWDRLLDANLRGNIALAQSFLSGTKAGGPKTVIGVLDQKLENMNPDFFTYTIGKGGFQAALRMMALDPAFADDRIYGLAPGLTLPSHDQTDEEFGQSARMNLLKRVTRPEEIAQSALFLTGGHLASGETLFVDSGQHLLNHRRDVMYLIRGEQ